MSYRVDDIMGLAPVIPVLVIDDVVEAVPIARALVAGGLRALEVTLRTAAALDVIREMTAVEGAVVGAGTVLNAIQLDDAVAAGAEFIVSPGLTEPLARAAIASGTAFLPGTANASDIMRGLDLGLTRFKFFPAEASGGISALSALAGPFGNIRFCPTGGITEATAQSWLDLSAVACIGGSWVIPKGPKDYGKIEALARAASQLKR